MTTTPEVILREAAPDDLSIFYEQQRDPAGVHMAAFTVQDPDDRTAFDAHWAHILADPNVVFRTILADGQVAGSVLSYVGDIGPEVSYWLGQEYWGRGVATAALREFLKAQTTRPLFARAAADNAGSLRVLEKCGFVITGRERGYASARKAVIDEYVLELSGDPANHTANPYLDRWRAIVFNRDLRDLQAILAEDVVFRSPYAWRPYEGRQAAWLLLSTVLEVFQEFAYHRELVDGDNWALEFSARVGGLSVKGIDLIQLDGYGRIVEFEVFIRPFNGLQALGAAMAERLERRAKPAL
jgi:RimJ/RimL family protein N-acetyltransferase